MVPYPNNPPPGTDLATVWEQYREAVWVGLYQGSPQPCPPPPYSSLLQPSYPGYQLRPAAAWSEVPTAPGPGVSEQRFAAAFAVPGGSPPVTVTGWFAAALLSTGEYVTMGVFPFAGPLTLAGGSNGLLLNVTASTALTGQPGGDSAVNFEAVQQTFGGRAMARTFRREQRALLNTLSKVLTKALLWDAQLPRPDAYKGVLARTAMFPNLPPPGVQWHDQVVALRDYVDEVLLVSNNPPSP